MFIKIFSLLYSVVYFAFRGMLSIFLAKITGNNDIVSVAFLISIFNVVYATTQIFNGKMIENFGFKYISIICFLGAIIMGVFLIKGLSFGVVASIIAAISFCFSSATIVITVIASKFFPKTTNLMIGFFRMCLVFISGLLIGYCTDLIEINPHMVILLFQGLLLIAGIAVFFLEQLHVKKTIELNRKRDLIFWLLCCSGTFSSLAYFIFQAGYLQVLYTQHSGYLKYLSNGFGLGNLFVMMSFFIDFRKISIILNAIKVLALINVIFFGKYLLFTYLMIGVVYANHILPLGFISKNYEMPVFHLSLYNSVIMLTGSFGFLSLASYFFKYFGLTQVNVFLVCKILVCLSILNLVFYVYWTIKEKKINNI